MSRKKIIKISLSIILFFILSFTVIYHNVNKKVSTEDKYYIKLFTKDIEPLSIPASYHDELRFIKEVQNIILDEVAFGDGIQYNHTREPIDLYKIRKGLCYDRSRLLEKIFSYYGFKTRHVAIYHLKKNTSKWSILFKQHIPSHAISEVLTQKGWLIIDSNNKWIGLNTDSLPVSMKEIGLYELIGFDIISKFTTDFFYKKGNIVIYGLYSRHGKFYPPYNIIPDYNLSELLYNVSTN